MLNNIVESYEKYGQHNIFSAKFQSNFAVL